MGKLIIFSAPSGSGKSTIINRLMQRPELHLAFSISCTSRAPRGTEQNGVEYFFITPEEFRERISRDEFLEYEEVYENRSKRVPTAKLNEVMLPIIENYPPPAWKGKYIKIKYITQLPAGSVPSFVFFCNLPQWIKDPYKRFLENKIRENWDFTGTPINIFIREK